MRKAAAAALTTNAAVASGIDLVGQVGATAAEMMRTRRDPANIARKRRRAAKRRARAWTVGAVASGGATAAAAVTLLPGLSAGAVLALIFLGALFVWCVVGAVRAAVDLRARTRAVAALPPPSPARRAVAPEIRPEIAKLDGYSDGLRHLVAMIGIVDDDPGVRALRDETLSAADASEAGLRQRAADLTGLLKARRAAPPGGAGQLDAAADLLRRQLRNGVAGYGELVSAAGEAVAASRQLADQGGGSGAPSLTTGSTAAGADAACHHELEQHVDQLRALAAGMRELTTG
jgi:hypothetical protein